MAEDENEQTEKATNINAAKGSGATPLDQALDPDAESVNGEGTRSAADDSTDEVELDEDLAEAKGEGEADADVDVDEVLAEVDPDFKENLVEISDQDFKGVVIERDSAADEVDETEPATSVYKTLWNNLPGETKKRYYLVAGVVAVMLPLAFLIYRGRILPDFKLPYHVNMNELTNKVFTYPVDTVQVPLFDDFQTTAHTIQFPSTVINLKSSGDDPAYGEFEFSLVLRDENLAVAVKAKEAEILDLMQRVLEQVTWKELQSPIGKEKVKKVIRHQINGYLQGNVVLGVYYRNIVLER